MEEKDVVGKIRWAPVAVCVPVESKRRSASQ